MKTIIRMMGLFAATVCFSAAVSAATFVVNTTNDTADAAPGDGICADAAAACSLRAAITEANTLAGDDTITVPAGTYTQALVAANEDNNAGGDWDIRSNLTINGAGAASTIIQAAATPGTATERVMESPLTTSVVSITGVTLRHGNKTGAAATTTRGGGIRNAGTMTISDSIVTANRAAGSGGVRNERVITLDNVTVSDNACNTTGATCFGGGMYNTLAINAEVIIKNSRFTGNTSTATGLNGFAFAAGAGIESTSGFNISITNSVFSNNVGTGNGSGGSNGNGLRLLPTAASTASITGSLFSGNSGTGGTSIQGSGITVFTSGTGTITGTWDKITVTGNSGNNAAAGVLFNATGGAMTFTITNSTISNNSGVINGAGVLMSNVGATAAAASTFNFVNSTISGNTASNNGGGVLVEQPAAGSITANFNFSTIAGNRANNDNAGTEGGGGIFKATGTVNLKNSIVADNTVGTGGTAPDISGSIASLDYNHIEDITGATITGATGNNVTGSDPQLGPLANNGGTTLTHLPSAISPVVNTIPSGTNDCGGPITVDQRGFSRPQSTGCEKGSVEVGAVAASFDIGGRISTAGGNGIRNALVTLSGGGLAQPIVTVTGSFGYYFIPDVPGGATYTITVNAKRFTFSPSSRQITLNGDLTNENFIANP